MKNETYEKYENWDIDFLLRMNNMAHTKEPMDKITEYIEGNRILPPGTPRPGAYSFEVNPFMNELQDNISMSSHIQNMYVLKGVQITCTTTLVENSVAFFIDEQPLEQLLVSGTEKLLKEWGEIRLEPLLDSLNLRNKIFSQFGNKNNRKSGDTQNSKFYAGGALHLATARSAPSQRMKSKQFVIVDEADSAPVELSTGEGSYIGVLEGRMVAYGDRKKFVVLSTPTTYENSVVWPLYKSGDQRHYYMPCPDCGAYFTPIKVDAENETVDWSLFKADMDGDIVKDVWLECEHCKYKIHNYDKTTMLPDGEWRPHANAPDEYTVSYYIPAILSPIGMLDWRDIYKKYIKALNDDRLMPTFFNLYLGVPYKETGEKPKLEQLIELRSGYEQGEIPNGVLFLTMTIDVQRGSKRKKQDERIEVEICGHGEGYRMWSIAHWIIPGSTKDAFAGAWEELDQRAANGDLLFTRNDGVEFFPRMVLADSGDGEWYDVVYKFTERWDNTYPYKGQGSTGLKRRKGEKDDEVTPGNFKRYAIRHMKKENVMLFEVSTNYYKNILYSCLKKTRNKDGSLPTGYQSFPKDYSEDWFKQLTAEEKLSNGTFKSTQKPHEALDLHFMNLAAGDAVLDMMVERIRESYRNAGTSETEIMQIDKRFALKYFKEQTRRVT